MAYHVDQRGSKDQRILYDYMVSLYPHIQVIYEFPLYELNQRVDIFVPSIGLAIEYHGRQHYEFIQHFHKDLDGFKKSKEQDQKKLEYLILKGIKFVEIPYNKMVKSQEELKALIDSIPYPDIEYIPIDETNKNKEEFLEEQRDFRKKVYQQRKQNFIIDPVKKKDQLEKQRQYRKDAYRKYKETLKSKKEDDED